MFTPSHENSGLLESKLKKLIKIRMSLLTLASFLVDRASIKSYKKDSLIEELKVALVNSFDISEKDISDLSHSQAVIKATCLMAGDYLNLQSKENIIDFLMKEIDQII